MARNNTRSRGLSSFFIIVLVLFVLLIAGSVFLLKDNLPALGLVKPVSNFLNAEEFSGQLPVTIRSGETELSGTAALDKFQSDDVSAYALTFSETGFYYTDGTLVLENGRAVALSEEEPSGASLGWKEILYLYRHVPVTKVDGDTFTAHLQGKELNSLLSLLGVSTENLKEDTLDAELTIKLTDNIITGLSLTCSAEPKDGSGSIFAELTLRDISYHSDMIPSPEVLSALRGGYAAADKEYLQNLRPMISALSDLYSRESFSAELSLSASLGTIDLGKNYSVYSAQTEIGRVTLLDDGKIPVYMGENGACGTTGLGVSFEHKEMTDPKSTLSFLYVLLLNGDVEKTEADGVLRYSFTVPEDTIARLMKELAPETEMLSITYEPGVLTLMVTDDTLSGLSFRSSGTVDLLILKSNILLQAEASVGDLKYAIPAAVMETLSK